MKANFRNLLMLCLLAQLPGFTSAGKMAAPDASRTSSAAASTPTFFPQVAVGGGYSTLFTFGNTGSAVLSGTLNLSDQKGNPLTLSATIRNSGEAPVEMTGSSFPVRIDPGGVTFITANPVAPDTVSSGWARFDTTSPESLYGVATFQSVVSGILQSTAGVLPSQPVQSATIPVDYDVSEGRFVGYAVANPAAEPLDVSFAVVDQLGSVVDEGFKIHLAAGQQIARFVHQDFTRQQFKGSIVLRAPGGKTFVAVALVQNQGRLTVIPVQTSLQGSLPPGVITTYAGPPMPVDGALATKQSIDYPSAVAPDGAGGFYVASRAQNTIYRVGANGTLTRVAGNGSQGYAGDGGQATAAILNTPQGIAADLAGNLYIADTYNHRVRRVTPAGVISTVAGFGTPGYYGDSGPATSAELKYPTDVVLDSAGTLYIAEWGNNRIRRVTAGGTITTVAGNGYPGFNGDGGRAVFAQLNHPDGVGLDEAGNLYIADYWNHRVRKVTPEGIISTVAGNGTSGFSGDGGTATSAQLDCPSGVSLDVAGNLYVTDSYNHRIRKISPSGVISTAAGTGVEGFEGDGGNAESSRLSFPSNAVPDSAGNLFISDLVNNRIRKVTPVGMIQTVAGNGTSGYAGDGGSADSALLNNPSGVALDPAGSLYVADTYNHRIRRITPAGTISTFAGNGSAGFSGDGGSATSANLNFPSDLVFDPAGNLYVADAMNHRIRRITPAGRIDTVAGNGAYGFGGDGGAAISAALARPTGVGFSGDTLYIADTDNHRIRKVLPSGVISTVAGNGIAGFSGDGGNAVSAQLNRPSGVALSPSGNLYIADTDNHVVRMVTPVGLISTVAGSGTSGTFDEWGAATGHVLTSPRSVAIDPAGNLYIADQEYHRICKVVRDGTIRVVAGAGLWVRSVGFAWDNIIYGFSGDGTTAPSAQLNSPAGITFDSAGDLYIADQVNQRIRKIHGIARSTNFFPQVAFGGGYTTVFTFGNSGSSTLSGFLTLFDQAGSPLNLVVVVDNPGEYLSQTAGVGPRPITIPPGGVGFATVGNDYLGSLPKSCWAQFDAFGGSSYSVSTFRNVTAGGLQSIAGVLPSAPTPYASIPVDYDVNQGRYVGYAVANVGVDDLEVKLAVLDQAGNILEDKIAITLPAGRQLARFLHQDFAMSQLRGSMVLRSRNGKPFVVVALILDREMLTVIPVKDAKTPRLSD